MKIFEELNARGLVAQMTHPEEVKKALNEEKISFYIGFDATANSLHVGSMLQLITARRLQLAGHTPILLCGGATTKIGDPSGKDDVRKMLTDEEINHNIECFKKQFAKFVDMNSAEVVNNDDWTKKMSIYDFIRLGFNFNINDMLRQECYVTRRESGGLTLGEMCYLPMQSLDFMYLYENLNCRMQMGGNDQWSNILGGVNLIRKTKGEKGNVLGLTFNLLTTSEGKKMGKTEKGALWLDREKTSPYEFFQYWRNTADEDVIKTLKYLTFIPLEEIDKMAEWQGADLNKAKEILAVELTKMVHGEEEAEKALRSSKDLFGGGGNSENMPTTKISLNREIGILDLLLEIGLIPSKGEGRRLIEQGGISINEKKVDNVELYVKEIDFTNGELIIRKGKKVFHKVTL